LRENFYEEFERCVKKDPVNEELSPRDPVWEPGGGGGGGGRFHLLGLSTEKEKAYLGSFF